MTVLWWFIHTTPEVAHSYTTLAVVPSYNTLFVKIL